jgi:hypothetical protein
MRDNIKMNLGEIGCEFVDLNHLVQDRYNLWSLVNTIMRLRVP